MTKQRLFAVGGVIILLVLVIVYLTHPSTNTITNYPPHSGPIVAFGDSLVEGYGANPGHDFVSDLSAIIKEPIKNLGESGDTTVQGLARIQSVIALHPRIVILLLGGNDYIQRMSRDTTFANLHSIVTALQADGAVVVLLGVRGGVLEDKFAQPFAILASAKGTLYVPDVLNGLLGDPKYMFDEVHPNDAGYEIIAQRVYLQLQKVLH